MTDDLPFGEPLTAPTMNGAVGRKCGRHVWMTYRHADGDETRCLRCSTVRDESAVRRGRTNLRAGKDAERAIAKAYPSGRRVGQAGGPEDVIVGELFVIQSKAGRGWFREALWDELAKLPRSGGRIPTLVISDRPGPGHRTRRLVIRTLDDDVALHGETA